MAREVLLETLRENGGSTTLTAAEDRLYKHGLGFGVEPIDVIYAAAEDRLVGYNPQTKIVSLMLKF